MSAHHGLEFLVVERFGHHGDRAAAVVLASPACAARHLDELGAGHLAARDAVELVEVREDDCFRGHVDAHREGLRREQDLDVVLLEQDFDDFLDDREQARVVDADSVEQEVFEDGD